MNMSDAKAKLEARGWVGLFRPVWAAAYTTVGKPGEPEYFTSADQAECAAWRALRNVEQPVMVRSGDRCKPFREAAERLFRKGRVVEVERKGKVTA